MRIVTSGQDKRCNGSHRAVTRDVSYGQLGTGVGDMDRVTDKERMGIAKFFSVDKAPDPDGLPHLAFKVATAGKGLGCSLFRSAMQKRQDKGVFPEIWRR